jgi:hypothetical protein
MRDKSAVRLSGTRTVRPGRAGREQPDVPFSDQVGERETTVLVFLGHGDDEAQVALDQLLHRLLIAGAHLTGQGDLLLLGE